MSAERYVKQSFDVFKIRHILWRLCAQRFVQAKVKVVSDLVWSHMTGSFAKDAQHVQVCSSLSIAIFQQEKARAIISSRASSSSIVLLQTNTLNRKGSRRTDLKSEPGCMLPFARYWPETKLLNH